MSTASMQQSSTPIVPLPATEPATSLDLLIDSSALHPEDRVLVIGHKLSAALIALAHSGCGAASGVDPASIHLRRDGAEVVWLTGVDEIAPPVAAAVGRMPSLRLVAIELETPAALPKLQVFLRRLREMGLVGQTIHHVGGKLVIVARQGEWLQWIA
jgi:hypothetical protein